MYRTCKNNERIVDPENKDPVDTVWAKVAEETETHTEHTRPERISGSRALHAEEVQDSFIVEG